MALEDVTRASEYLRSLLGDYGLESLTSWAINLVQEGRTETEVARLMRDRPEFKQRFPAIFERERLGMAPLSPGEYVAYERQAAQVMRASGLPAGFYDQPDDFTRLLSADVSPVELEDRIKKGYQQIAQTPPEVRDVWSRWFGPSTDAALAAFFLDPDRAEPVLLQQAEAAKIGGWGQRFGIGLGREQGIGLAQAGVTDQDAQAGFAQLSQQRALFDESVTESDDLDINTEGVAAVLGQSGAAAERVRRRRAGREAAFSGSGGPTSSKEGVTGYGTAGKK